MVAVVRAAPVLAQTPPPPPPPIPVAPAPAGDPPSAAGATATPTGLVKLSLELEYRTDARSGRCDEKLFRSEVAQRLHRDPFDPDPSMLPGGRVTVVLAHPSRDFVVKYLWKLDKVDVGKGSYLLTSQTCRPVLVWAADTLVEDINAIEADWVVKPPAPAVSAAPAPPPEPPEPLVALPIPLPVALVEPTAPPPPIVKRTPPPPSVRKVEVHAGVDAIFNPFAAPSVSLGFAPWVGVRLREPALSVNLALRALWSVNATTASNGVPFRWSYTSGVLAAALHKSVFFGGPLVEVGTLTPHTDDTRVVGTLTPAFVAVGLQAGFARSVADLCILRASIEGEYVPLAASLRDPNASDRSLWAMPSFSATVAAGMEFPLW